MKYNLLFIFGIFFVVSCNHTKARRPVNKNRSSSINEYSISINKAINEAEAKKIKAYIKKDSLLDYTYSPYGFAYAKLKTTNKIEKRAKERDTVIYSKTVYSLRNELIYNQIQNEIIIGNSTEIKGIQEGLKLMQEHEEFKFIFSSFVSHGFTGDSNKIGSNTPIVVKIKLLKLNN